MYGFPFLSFFRANTPKQPSFSPQFEQPLIFFSTQPCEPVIVSVDNPVWNGDLKQDEWTLN
jgi:hypothetical protein